MFAEDNEGQVYSDLNLTVSLDALKYHHLNSHPPKVFRFTLSRQLALLVVDLQWIIIIIIFVIHIVIL